MIGRASATKVAACWMVGLAPWLAGCGDSAEPALATRAGIGGARAGTGGAAGRAGSMASGAGGVAVGGGGVAGVGGGAGVAGSGGAGADAAGGGAGVAGAAGSLPTGCPDAPVGVEVLAEDEIYGGGGAVVATPSYLYWQMPGNVYSDSGVVLRKARCDTSAPVKLASKLEWPQSMAARGDQIVWANAGPYVNGYSQEGSVWRSTGPSATLWLSDTNSVWGVAVSGTQTFYSTGSGFGQIRRIGASGGSSMFASRTGYELAADATHLFGVDKQHIWRVPLAGGADVDVTGFKVCADGFGTSFAIDSTHVYWTNLCSGVLRVAKEGGTPESLVASSESLLGFGTGRLAVDEHWLYFADKAGLQAVAKGGGAAVTVAVYPSDSQGGVALDETAVYWRADLHLLRTARLGPPTPP